MGCRRVVGLEWAREEKKGPFSPNPSAARGARRAGLRFEKLVGKEIGGKTGQWFRYFDVGGEGWCQTDCLVLGEREVMVVECKLSDTEEAVRQVEGLYFPVVEMVYGKRALGMVVVRNLVAETEVGRVVLSFKEGVERAKRGGIPVLQWDVKRSFPFHPEGVSPLI